jgi:HK97 family phage major capsid protein
MPEKSEVIRQVKAKLQTRTFTIGREAQVDPESRTVNLAFASDKPVEHYFGNLALSMDKKAVRTERLASGAPLLMDHNTRDQIGVVTNFSFDKDGVARADVKFSRSVRGEEIFQDVKEGIRQNVSVGFMVYEMTLVEEKDGELPTYRCDDWEPMEISIVSIPADQSVGIGRSFDQPIAANVNDYEQALLLARELLKLSNNSNPDSTSDSPEERAHSTKEENEMTPEEIAAAAKAAEEKRSAELAATRRTEIVAFADIFGEGDLAREMILASEEITVDDVREAIRKKQKPATVVPPVPPAVQAAREGGIQLARTIPRYAKLNSFTGEGAAERAYRFGQFLMASVLGNTKSREFCAQNGIAIQRAMGESVNELGGYLVPDEFGNDLIDLREQFGVFRRNAKIVPMASDTRSDPRRTGGLTAYFVAEAGAITASDAGWDRVELVAKKLAVLARYSSEVNEDSVINFGDTLAGEIAYAFAEKEDRCGFLGDATSTYGGITGICNKLLNLSAIRADVAGLVVGTGNLFSELVIGDFEAVVAKLPQYADTDAAAWYVHRGFYWNVMVKAMLASGGVTAAEIEDARKQRFMGYRVEFTQVMPNTDANDQIVALFGDLAKAASMGTRRDTQIALSEHSRFANDQIEIRGTERFDINVHDVGNQSSTAASRVPGPVIGLASAAS